MLIAPSPPAWLDARYNELAHFAATCHENGNDALHAGDADAADDMQELSEEALSWCYALVSEWAS